MNTIRGIFHNDCFTKNTVAEIRKIIDKHEDNFKEQLYTKYNRDFSISNKKSAHDIDWNNFITNILNENQYDLFINDIINDMTIQEHDICIENLKNALRQDGYEFESINGQYHICIKGSLCLIYLTNDEGCVVVNKKLICFDNLSQKIFQQEKDIYSLLYNKNCNIAPAIFFDQNESGNQNIIKMEKCDISLSAYIENDNDVTLNMIEQILEKIAKLHDLKIIHRDLHPGNFMLLRDEWFIIDFNISKHPFHTGLITIQNNFGVREYTDPIIYNHSLNKACVKTDIFSIGKVINFIFTKNPNNYGHALKKISKKCTETDFDKRYTSVYEIINDLKSYIY